MEDFLKFLMEDVSNIGIVGRQSISSGKSDYMESKVTGKDDRSIEVLDTIDTSQKK